MAPAEHSLCSAWHFVPHASFRVIPKDGHRISAITGGNRPIHPRLSSSLSEAMQTPHSVCLSTTQPPASEDTTARSPVCSGLLIQVLRVGRAQGRHRSPAPGRVRPRGSHVTRPSCWKQGLRGVQKLRQDSVLFILWETCESRLHSGGPRGLAH